MYDSGHDDDPFTSPTEELPRLGHDYPIGSAGTRYGNTYSSTYSTSQSGPSTVSLIPNYRSYSGGSESTVDGAREDDEAHLTANMARQGASSNWDASEDADAERLGSAAHRTRRKTLRYSASPSPLKRAGTTLGGVSRSLRRVSLRVVNFSGMGAEDRVRLADLEDDDIGKVKSKEEDTEDRLRMEDYLKQTLPLRGRTLGFLKARNPVRLAMFRFLISPWTEPSVLVLIIVNAIVLTIQASRTLVVSGTSDNPGSPTPVKGYFHSWEDYALFGLFIIFTLEAFARICVSGLLLDPEVSVSSLFTSTFSPPTDSSISASAPNGPSTVAYSLSQPQPLHRGNSITQRLQRIHSNFIRPFALAHHSFTYPPKSTTQDTPRTPRPRSDTARSTTPMHEKSLSQAQTLHAHICNPSEPNFLSTFLRSDRTRPDTLTLPFTLNVNQEHDVIRRNVPYLRHSWGRIDFLAVLGFWITFALATTGVERGSHHIGIFRAISVLRTARLLAVTSGTTTIMRSLKTARPLLAGVAYFVIFAMAFFSIVGVETFAGSFKRSCYLLAVPGVSDEINLGQACGAYIDPVSLNVTGFIQANGETGRAKGYVCPLGQVCKEGDNPEGGIENFDTFYNAVLQVIIVASANGWSPLMYSVIDSEYFASCFFFIVCIVVLNFWLINLFVAVITNTFSAIRANTKKSAFGAAPLGPVVGEQDDDWSMADARRASKRNILKDVYEYIRWCWVALALASLVLQATRTTTVGQTHQQVLDKGELALTVVFDIEIVIRILAELPDWRAFFSSGQNWLDTVLAIGSTVIQIPAVHDSAVYPWLTIFQILRFYRVILEVPRMRPLLLAVFGNMYGLANMTLFLLLMNYVAALIAVQLLRGDMTSDISMNFGQIFTSFLAVYQVFSSENWTDVLYDSTEAEIPLGQSVVVALFVTAWMLFANFIVFQMFIAVINENFDVAEESKKGKQASNYWAMQQPEPARAGWVRRLNPYRWLRPSPKTIKVDNLPSHLVLPMQKSLVQDHSLPIEEEQHPDELPSQRPGRSGNYWRTKFISILQGLFVGKPDTQAVPLSNLRGPRRQSMINGSAIDDDTDRHLELLAVVNPETAAAEGISEARYERRAMKADFIRDHPTYDKTFWVFSQKNILRRLCQRLVQPANGERIFGLPPSPFAHPMFQLFLLLAVIAGIVVEGVASPVYRRNYYLQYGRIRGSWFDIAETALGLTLLVEFLVKVVADGFVFTPNAYVRSIWNVLDLIVLAGILVNLTTGLIFIGGLSRFTRSLKALRALRLITLIENMRSTFQSLIISGAARIFDAALLAILYMIPYAVWGLNIFAGLMQECNDGNAQGASDCNYEYTNNIDAAGDSFGFLVPRVWDNPSPSTTFSFDTFRASLLILFETVSLEGWIDVLNFATSITGRGQQPSTNASQVNAIFFLIYNLMGGVVILTLFVSIIIGNFRSKTGAALLTQPQREWIDLQKLIKRQRPSKRPKQKPTSAFRLWCFERAVHKHGWWSRMMTIIFVVHVFALMTQTNASQGVAQVLRAYWFLFAALAYSIDTAVRLIGLGFSSFRANGWNLFDIIIAPGALVTVSIVLFSNPGPPEWIQQLQRLFIVSIAFKLVQRTNNLNKLFKTAMASLSVILSLLALWLVLFLFFAILFLEVFSLTKWYSGENWNMNYATMGSALVMLAFMSTGEGWNQYMHDYAIVYPQCTNSSAEDPDSDCGSVGWAFTLFIAWNLLSMYIFVNMFTGVVVESFSYVFQSTGGAKSITREEMRDFKKVWARFANQKTGYLERSNFVPFFGQLRGIFEVRIYPREFNFKEIAAKCKSHKEYDGGSLSEGLDLEKVSRILDTIDYSAIRRRRSIYNRLYHESVLFHEKGKGISFTNMLLMLAHHKLIDDREALVLKDLVIRTEQNKLVSDLVNLDRVQSLLRMTTLRRRFLAHRENMRNMRMSQQDIPAIVVDSLPVTPPPLTRDITSPSPSWSPTISPALSPMSPVDVSFALDTSAGVQRSRRISDTSMLTTDSGRRYSRDMSLSRDSYGDDPQAVLTSIQNSIWGEMMLEAAEDETED